MQPSDNEELTDRELDSILPEWKAPAAPARLRTAVFPGVAMPWWRKMWSSSFRIPAPVACLILILLALVVWRQSIPRTIYMPAFTPAVSGATELQPVIELRPRIIRSADVKN
jgi:hypothetical protein